jgi:hypothetical protein
VLTGASRVRQRRTEVFHYLAHGAGKSLKNLRLGLFASRHCVELCVGQLSNLVRVRLLVGHGALLVLTVVRLIASRGFKVSLSLHMILSINRRMELPIAASPSR